ncbi:MAG: hypothetical protein J6A98_01735 [Clostridia bacterium]|nr:hypothetical protein [Clostridia bacterium]
MNKNRVTPTEVGVVGVCTDFSCNNCKKKSNKRLLKIFAAGGLAFFMGVGTLCGVLIAPMNSAHATTSGATSASNAANPAGVAQSPDRALEAVRLDPATDPVVYTTESGFEIKSHTVAGNTLANSKVQYFTLGSYNGTPLNWIILATSPTLVETSTDAGIAINDANANGMVSMMTDSKLLENQALVISEKVFGTYSFEVISSSQKTATTPSWSGYLTGKSIVQSAAKTLLDEVSDYYSSYTGDYSDFVTTTNNFFSNNTFGLDSYLNKQIVHNTNFNNNYGFLLTSSQISNYLAPSVAVAKNFDGTNCAYWCPTNIVASCTYSVTGTGGRLNAAATGSGTLTITGEYVNTNGNVTSLASITGTLSLGSRVCYYSDGTSSNDCYLYKPVSTYTSSGTTSVTGCYRPAMVVDLSKF